MTMIFVEEDGTAAVCGAVQACAANVVATVTMDRPATVLGTPGSSEASPGQIDGGQQRSVLMFELAPGATDWAGGTAIVRVAVTTANMQVSLEAIYLCQRDSACGAKATYGSATALGLGLGSTGVQSVNVTVSAITALTSDLLYVVCEFAAAAGMNQTIGLTPSENIDTPINAPAAVGENYLAAHRTKRILTPILIR